MTAIDLMPHLDDDIKYRVEVRVVVPNTDTMSELQVCTVVPTPNTALTTKEVSRWLYATFEGCVVDVETISHDSGPYPTIKLKVVHQFGSRRKLVIHT